MGELGLRQGHGKGSWERRQWEHEVIPLSNP